MGVELIWQNSVAIALEEIGLHTTQVEHETYHLLMCNDKIAINLISIENDYKAEELLALQVAFQLKSVQLVQLWEDVWRTRQHQVLGRISSILGLNVRLHGRKGTVTVIDQKLADDFLNQNHIQATAKAKYRFGLEIDGKLVAVACFSNARYMTRISKGYRSVELIRFATLMGFTVIGGFTKLLKHLIKEIAPNDVMSYADRDWSLGNAYEQSGFKLEAVTPPSPIWLDKEALIRYFPHRLPANSGSTLASDLMPIFNTGNLKYILYL